MGVKILWLLLLLELGLFAVPAVCKVRNIIDVFFVSFEGDFFVKLFRSDQVEIAVLRQQVTMAMKVSKLMIIRMISKQSMNSPCYCSALRTSRWDRSYSRGIQCYIILQAYIAVSDHSLLIQYWSPACPTAKASSRTTTSVLSTQPTEPRREEGIMSQGRNWQTTIAPIAFRKTALLKKNAKKWLLNSRFIVFTKTKGNSLIERLIDRSSPIFLLQSLSCCLISAIFSAGSLYQKALNKATISFLQRGQSILSKLFFLQQPSMQSAQKEWAQVAATLKTLGSARQKQQILSSRLSASWCQEGMTEVRTSMTSWRKQG